jgi:hypothetical protein
MNLSCHGLPLKQIIETAKKASHLHALRASIRVDLIQHQKSKHLGAGEQFFIVVPKQHIFEHRKVGDKDVRRRLLHVLAVEDFP